MCPVVFISTSFYMLVHIVEEEICKFLLIFLWGTWFSTFQWFSCPFVDKVNFCSELFQKPHQYLGFTQQQIDSLTKGNKLLQNLSVNNLTTQLFSINDHLVHVTAENKIMKETILDLQSCSMRVNLVFSGIPETPTKKLLLFQYQINETIKDNTFHHLHRLGPLRQIWSF